jgi:hypothetical protein
MALVTALVLPAALIACGNDDDVGTDVTPPETTTTAETTTTETTEVPDGELPGERMDIFPYEDAELAVVGVEADDTLNVRSGPGVDFDVVVELDPLATGIIATGHNRSLDDAIWAEIQVDGATGWANTAFLSQLGDTDDITSQLYPSPADRPSAETMLELGQEVAEEVAGPDLDGGPPISITVVDGPSVADLGEVTVDVTGFGDDALLGYRLVVFAEPDPGGESFTVRTVESTPLCRRGVSDGLCL